MFRPHEKKDLINCYDWNLVDCTKKHTCGITGGAFRDRTCGITRGFAGTALAAMQCPVCRETRYSNDWSRSQWQQHQPIMPGLNGCKRCRTAEENQGIGQVILHCEENLARQQYKQEVIRRDRGLFSRLTRRVLQYRQAEDWLRGFVQEWMSQPHWYRKTLSYEGAIRCWHSEHQPCGFDKALGEYFDPGNRVYACALTTLCPSVKEFGYNDETMGDICEGLLAVGMQSQDECARNLAVAIEEVAGSISVLLSHCDGHTLEALNIYQEKCNPIIICD